MSNRLGCAPWLLVAVASLTSPATLRADQPTRPVEYNRDIRPILAENCFACHGPDKGTRKAGLRLDLRAAAIEKGAITPGDLDASELVSRIVSDDAKEVMPPPDSTKSLSPAQKDLLKRWVAEGAAYQAHWSYEPIRTPPIPTTQHAQWARTPIDQFIAQGLEARQVEPSPAADRATLLRRLSLDLIGLPPTAAEVAGFLADASADAYERQVDRLLASPHFGERMAVPWLDLVRFADTVGYHGDQTQNVFPYRDYVIEAFNSNKPFDQFTAEQIAGDLLPGATEAQRVASGFNRLNMVTREGGAQPREYLAKYTADRVRTVAITWLGSTMGCAECHDHKFDPFTAKDFYRMGAFFADVEQWGVYMDYVYSPNPDLRGYSNDHPFPPEIDVPSAALRLRLEQLEAKRGSALAAARDRLATADSSRAARAAWATQIADFLKSHPDGWAQPPATVQAGPEVLDGARVEEDGTIALAGVTDTKKSYQFRLTPAAGWLSAIRLELLPSAATEGRFTRGRRTSVPVRLAALSEPVQPAGATPNQKLTFYRSDANARGATFANGHRELNINEVWYASTADLTQPQTAVYLLDRPIQVAAGDAVIIDLRAEAVGSVRLTCSPISFANPTRPELDPLLVAALATPEAARSPEQWIAISDAYLLSTRVDDATLQVLHRLAVEQGECRGGMARTMVTRAREPVTMRVLNRGNWQDESGEVVEPGVPHLLPQPLEAGSRRLNRLDLARWITAPDNPLTARVFVNRLWRQFFGAGLAAVMEDVGAQGEWPSHPDLPDWLAADFRDHAWDVKRLVREVVLSATYRQSSRLRPELREVDPSNRWLASQSPRRLDAEFVRDNALAISGLLNPEVGGPSVFPYQPPGYYAALQFPTRDYIPQDDGRQHRRGLYTHWQRTFLHPMMANFDAPSREECIASRNLANTPQQALTLLNDPNFVAAARELARRTLTEAQAIVSDGDRIDSLFRRALARPARDREVASLVAFLEAQRAANRADPAAARQLVRFASAPASGLDPVEWASWTEVCRVLLNLHETITRY